MNELEKALLDHENVMEELLLSQHERNKRFRLSSSLGTFYEELEQLRKENSGTEAGDGSEVADDPSEGTEI
jgi:hypothetical protein